MPSVFSKFADAKRTHLAELFCRMTFRQRTAVAMRLARKNKMFSKRGRTARLSLHAEELSTGEIKCYNKKN